MAISVNTLAPRVIALAAVGYCVWPSLMEFMSDVPNKPPVKPAALEATLLRPKMTPEPVRDLFRVKVATKEDSPSKVPEGGGAAGPNPTVAAIGVISTKPLDGLTLDATCIVGAQRMAVINGRLYSVKEILSASNTTTAPLKIIDVLPHKVLLEGDGKTLELVYSNVTSSVAAMEDSVVRGGPDGITTGPAAKNPRGFSGVKASGKSRSTTTGKQE
jgi:hypothetical protein